MGGNKPRNTSYRWCIAARYECQEIHLVRLLTLFAHLLPDEQLPQLPLHESHLATKKKKGNMKSGIAYAPLQGKSLTSR
jgi:hypothetical protein